MTPQRQDAQFVPFQRSFIRIILLVLPACASAQKIHLSKCPMIPNSVWACLFRGTLFWNVVLKGNQRKPTILRGPPKKRVAHPRVNQKATSISARWIDRIDPIDPPVASRPAPLARDSSTGFWSSNWRTHRRASERASERASPLSVGEARRHLNIMPEEAQQSHPSKESSEDDEKSANKRQEKR